MTIGHPESLRQGGPLAEAIEQKPGGRLKQGALLPMGEIVTEALMGPTDAAKKIDTVPVSGGKAPSRSTRELERAAGRMPPPNGWLVTHGWGTGDSSCCLTGFGSGP